ncbi:hypothetical protein RR48_04591 [Papilio machaon]|uniref:Uncharacterized protein n=1 Tax=Papilio machaon TaxID=76193 RepID=A0A0N1IG17_PAPMA|nr:hypothetical protein RR48_04591 [Papilio machaon]
MKEKEIQIRPPARTLIGRDAELLPLIVCLLCSCGLAPDKPLHSYTKISEAIACRYRDVAGRRLYDKLSIEWETGGLGAVRYCSRKLVPADHDGRQRQTVGRHRTLVRGPQHRPLTTDTL